MASLFRRWSGPAVIFLAGTGVQVSGVENQALSAWLFVVALVWGGWAVVSSKGVQEVITGWNIRGRMALALTSVRRLAKRRTSSDDSELQLLRGALHKCKKEHAEAAIRWFADRVSMNIDRARTEGRTVEDFRVTVRFADYKDLDLAKEIEEAVKNCTQWAVEIDGSNNPTIMPDKDFKIVFNIGPWPTFREVVWAFSYGELVKGKIGSRVTERFDDTDHLIVNVLPTITQ